MMTNEAPRGSDDKTDREFLDQCTLIHGYTTYVAPKVVLEFSGDWPGCIFPF